jgi:hypothetical protein
MTLQLIGMKILDQSLFLLSFSISLLQSLNFCCRLLENVSENVGIQDAIEFQLQARQRQNICSYSSMIFFLLEKNMHI